MYPKNTGDILYLLYGEMDGYFDVGENPSTGEITIVRWQVPGVPMPTPADVAAYAASAEYLRIRKDQTHEQRRVLRTEAELGGFTHDNHRFDSDRDSILRITNAAQAATVASMLQMPFATVWTCADGYQYEVPDAATMLSIHGALVTHGQACHSYSQALADLIEGAVSLEALAAMDLSAGWPE